MQITSRDNSLLRQARAVRDGKADDLIFVEGLRLCVEALRSNLELEAVIFSEQLAGKEKAVAPIAEISRASRRVASVTEKLLESISYTKTPQGIVVLARRPESSEQRLAASLTNERSAAGGAASDQQSRERRRGVAHSGSRRCNRDHHDREHQRSIFAEVVARSDGFRVSFACLARRGVCESCRVVPSERDQVGWNSGKRDGEAYRVGLDARDCPRAWTGVVGASGA